MCRRIAIIVLSLAALVLAGLAYLYYDITRPDPQVAGAPAPAQPPAAPATPAEPAARPGLPQAAPAPDDQELRGQVRRIREAVQRGEHAPFELRVTEEQINGLLLSLPQVRAVLAEQRLRAPHIRFEPGKVVVNARIAVAGGVEARLSASGQVWAERGRLAYRTTGVYIGSLPAPRQVSEEIDRQTRTAVERLNDSFQGEVEEVTVAQALLVARGKS